MKKLVAACVIVAGLITPVAAEQQTGRLAAARELYTAARYDEALTVLNELREGDAAHRRFVEQYRSLCLLALGRAAEAEHAIEALVEADPLYRPGEADASPRVRATFTEVRRRLLPGLATAKYLEARGAYDRGEWPVAQERFAGVLSLIDDPDAGGGLTDLRILTAGFLELSTRAAAPSPVPAPPPPPEDILSSAREEPVTPAPDPLRVYHAQDAGVSAPVAIQQAFPLLPSALMTAARPQGLLEVIIDEQGRVVSATVRSSVHPTYDAQLLSSAPSWKYSPATLAGQPVKFRKLIQVVVKR